VERLVDETITYTITYKVNTRTEQGEQANNLFTKATI